MTITIKFLLNERFVIVESSNENFPSGRTINLGIVKMLTKKGYTITILPENQ